MEEKIKFYRAIKGLILLGLFFLSSCKSESVFLPKPKDAQIIVSAIQDAINRFKKDDYSLYQCYGAKAVNSLSIEFYQNTICSILGASGRCEFLCVWGPSGGMPIIGALVFDGINLYYIHPKSRYAKYELMTDKVTLSYDEQELLSFRVKRFQSTKFYGQVPIQIDDGLLFFFIARKDDNHYDVGFGPEIDITNCTEEKSFDFFQRSGIFWDYRSRIELQQVFTICDRILGLRGRWGQDPFVPRM